MAGMAELTAGKIVGKVEDGRKGRWMAGKADGWRERLMDGGKG
jgi:hypothetical protein